MITIKDFAKEYGCSESIIYRHIRNNREALGSNVFKESNKTFLTPEGVEFIRKLMIQPPAPVIFDEDPRVKRMEAELIDLRKQLKEKDDQMKEKDEQMKEKDKMLYRLIDQNQQLQLEAGKVRLIEAKASEAAERAETAEKEKKEAEIRVSEAEKREKEISSSLAEAKTQLQNASDIAEINAQERDRARQRAEAAEEEASLLKTENDAVWKRLEEVTKEKRNFFQRISDKIEKFFTE